MYEQRQPISRRALLQSAAGGFGAIALAGMLAELSAAEAPVDPLAPKPPHFPAKAKNVIFLYMSGGVSHVDTFDPKPRLTVDDGKELILNYWLGRRGPLKRWYKKPNWAFKPYGQSGIEVSDLFPHVGGMVDDLCMIRSMATDNENHYEATLAMHTGSFTFARPSVGAWVSYGLGTENQNLPSFVVIAPHTPYAGAQAWGADFLPGCYQGTLIANGNEPIANIQRRIPLDLQELELSRLQAVNQRHATEHPDAALDARIKSFETAFGMQREAPHVFDLSQETDATLALYGLSRGQTSGFGWQCLIARRMAEHGVRYIECIDTGSSGNWDSHGNMQDHAALAKNVDLPIAGLLQDLKARGMLDSTLVVWTSEFGRMPYTENPNEAGRNHHPEAFTSWLAGAGVKKGIVHGVTDDHGATVVDKRTHLHDFHATILHLLGLDHERLTYRYSGRDFRLTDVKGEVVQHILA